MRGGEGLDCGTKRHFTGDHVQATNRISRALLFAWLAVHLKNGLASICVTADERQRRD